jgi:hypothetical protein
MLARFNVGANNDTGLVDRTAVVSAVSHVFDGFTMLDAKGYWKGNPEESVVVEVYAGPTDTIREFADKCQELASNIALLCNQQCVGLSFVMAPFHLIDRDGKEVA